MKKLYDAVCAISLFDSRWLGFAYRQLRRVVPCDITHVLLQEHAAAEYGSPKELGPEKNLPEKNLPEKNAPQEIVPDKVIVPDKNGQQPDSAVYAGKSLHADSAVTCRQLSDDELTALSTDTQYEISADLLSDKRGEGYICYGALIDGQVAGYLLYATGEIAAHHNSGGTFAGITFKGIGLVLPNNTGYLFKCLVLTSYRGRGILLQLLHHAMADAGRDNGIVYWVTTTDLSNRAAFSAFTRAGFRRVGIAAEYVVLGRHLFRTPAVKLGNGNTVQMCKPASHAS